MLSVMASDEIFHEAVDISSPQLGKALSDIRDGRKPDPRRVERVMLSTLRYRLRMKNRPTPFGTMAGVSLGSLADETRVRIGEEHRKHVRADAGWVLEVAMAMLEDRNTRYAVGVAWNNLCSVRGGRLILPYAARSGEGVAAGSRNAEISLRFTPAVRSVMNESANGVNYRRLVEAMCDAHPGAGEETIDRMLHSLMRNEVLLTEFQAGGGDVDPLDHLIDFLQREAAGDATALRNVADLLDRYAGSGPGAGSDLRAVAAKAMRQIHSGGRSPFQVDLRLDAEFAVGQTVAKEAEKAAAALWRMAPRRVARHQSEYLSLFLERYGEDAVVPLLDLLDPHAGIGAPASYIWPASTAAGEQAAVGQSGEDAKRTSILADLLQDCLLSGNDELVLDDEHLDRLAHPDDGTAESLDLCVQILAPSAAAMDAGDFRLVISPTIGSTAAGSMLGRFAHMLDATSLLRELFSDQSAEEDLIIAEIDFQPAESRLHNVTRTPRVAARTIAVGAYPVADKDARLDLEDLAVVVRGNRLRLVWAPTGGRVKVVIPHMLNLATAAPNVARLMTELSREGLQQWRGWSWGDFESFRYLPRVVYGRTILQPARWLPSDAMRGGGDENWTQWLEALRDWQAQWNVPDRIRTVLVDRCLDLDLTDVLHCRLLRAELTRNPDLCLFEICAGDEDFGWSGGHANEVVFPLKRETVAASPGPDGSRRTVARRRADLVPTRMIGPRGVFQPGGEWVYLKVYANRTGQDRLLSLEVPRLLAACEGRFDRWFFIRYADPDAHLRIRLHGTPDDMRTHVMAAVHEWSDDLVAQRLIRGTVLEAYEPEYARYGGPGLMEAAEAFFHADSEIVLAQLQARARGSLPMRRDTQAAINFIGLLQSFGEWGWNRWIVDSIDRVATVRSELPPASELALLDPTSDWAKLRTTDAGASLVAGWSRWTDPAREYGRALFRDARPTQEGTRVLRSLLHMHFNRLAGTSRDTETRVGGIVRNAAWSHLERTR
ncbi:lantibiotic dehydratase [Kitasatospora hibisci]|uniref:lantibiotic dehydratase n=1 Tax=Kitasatospora hibisci TaxID=3369522 RepID=UPI0037551F29